MSLKLLKKNQNKVINQISHWKAIALTGENNQKYIQIQIATQGFTYFLKSRRLFSQKNPIVIY